MDPTKRTLLQLAGAALFTTALPPIGARAADFPSRLVRILVVFPAGGPGDVLARLIAPRLSEQWNVPVVVENKPGAAGSVAAGAVLREPADGHTLLFTSSTHVQAIGLKLKLSYDPIHDFRAISQIGVVPMVLMVRPDGPGTLEELIAMSRVKPITFGSFGAASTAHIYGEFLIKAAQLDAVNVPFAGGAPQITALLGGHITAAFVEGSQSLSFVRSGKLRPLAVTGTTRYRSLPDVKTFEELGYTGFDIRGFHGIMVRSDVPTAVADKLSKDIAAVVGDPKLQLQLFERGVESPNVKTDWNTAVRDEASQWTTLIEKTGIKIGQ